MAVRLVEERDDEGLDLSPQPVRWVPTEPPQPPQASATAAVNVQAVAILTALAAVVGVRVTLLLTILGSIGLTLYAEYQHTVIAVVAAALYGALAVVPSIYLALRKG